jgi:hypothetical protein
MPDRESDRQTPARKGTVVRTVPMAVALSPTGTCCSGKHTPYLQDLYNPQLVIVFSPPSAAQKSGSCRRVVLVRGGGAAPRVLASRPCQQDSATDCWAPVANKADSTTHPVLSPVRRASSATTTLPIRAFGRTVRAGDRASPCARPGLGFGASASRPGWEREKARANQPSTIYHVPGTGKMFRALRKLDPAAAPVVFLLARRFLYRAVTLLHPVGRGVCPVRFVSVVSMRNCFLFVFGGYGCGGRGHSCRSHIVAIRIAPCLEESIDWFLVGAVLSGVTKGRSDRGSAWARKAYLLLSRTNKPL